MRLLSGSSVLLTATLFAGRVSASIILSGPIPSTGNGIGAVLTSLTFQNTGTESGCVAFDGTSAVRGAGACPAGFAGGDESPGASQTNVFTPGDLGFSATRNFANLVILFNGNEGGNTADQAITLTSLGLSLYSTTGVRLATFTTTVPYSLAAIFAGVGNAGYGFVLDGPQAAQANAILATNPNLRIGTEATATNSQGGSETIQLTTLDSTTTPPPPQGEVPEPETGALLGAGFILISLGAARGRFKNKRAASK